MSIFDFLLKSESAEEIPASLPQTCYDIAYFVLPQFVFGDLERVTDLSTNSSEHVGSFWYLIACKAREIQPDKNVAQKFKCHCGSFDDSRKYVIFEYPTLTNDSDRSACTSRRPGNLLVLAPYYSAVLFGQSRTTDYYVLGEAPFSGTTLRRILPEGANCNLGPGPTPTVHNFLDAIREREASFGETP